MRNNSDHAMFPDASHDEQSLQNFMKSLRVHALGSFHEGGKHALEKHLAPRLATDDQGRLSRKAMREGLQQEPHHRWWSSMLRTTQEMLYDSVGPTIERQLPELIERARNLRGRSGSLTLDPDLETPRYLSAVDIHCKPGSYHSELAQDDVLAGAEFDRTYRLYSMGVFGPDLDGGGWSLIAWIKQTYPDFKPRRILDMGCTVGHSTLPYTEAFGDDVEVHAIDVAAPCLRYGHARAVAMDRSVHFSQQNAEATTFADGSFDLVVSHLMMHETSRRAVRNIFAETRRLLAPGGIMAHADGIRPRDNYSRYYSEWMAHYNNEPYLGAVQDEDFERIAADAGFDPAATIIGQAPLRLRDTCHDEPGSSSYLVVSSRV